MTLYHFTCEHAALRIKRARMLEPNPQPQLDGRPLIWLTDLESPGRLDVGLTSVSLHCDRMAYRATVDGWAHHWPDYLRALPSDVRLKARALTEGAGLPMHWYVSDAALSVVEIARWSE